MQFIAIPNNDNDNVKQCQLTAQLNSL